MSDSAEAGFDTAFNSANVTELLSQVYSCQNCGQSFSWSQIHEHEKSQCLKRPKAMLRSTTLDRKGMVNHAQDDEDEIDGKIPLPRFDDILIAEPGVGDVRIRPLATKGGCAPNLTKIFDTYHKRGYQASPTEGAPMSRSKSGLGATSSGLQRDDLRGKSACVYCGREFGENKFAHRLMHQRVCESNPRSKTWCTFCSREFKSTADALAVEQAAIHEEVCKDNPATMCRFCGIQCGGHMGETRKNIRARLEAHYVVCQSNPMNVAECRFCTRRFMSSSYGPAYVLCDAHQAQCSSNRRNQCRFCGLAFSAPMDTPPERAAIFQRRAHEQTCPAQLNAGGRGYYEHMSGAYVDFDFDRLFEQLRQDGHGKPAPRVAAPRPGSASAPPKMHATPSSGYQRAGTMPGQLQNENCRALLASIERELRELEMPKLRRRLRQLQLQFHPDKNIDQPTKERETAEIIFQYVQGIWDREFKKKPV